MERTDTEMLDWVIVHEARLSTSLAWDDWQCKFLSKPDIGHTVMTYGPTPRAAIASGMAWMDNHEVIVTGTSKPADLSQFVRVTKFCAKCFKTEVQNLGEICPTCLETLNHEDDDSPCCEEDHRP